VSFENDTTILSDYGRWSAGTSARLGPDLVFSDTRNADVAEKAYRFFGKTVLYFPRNFDVPVENGGDPVRYGSH